MPSLQQQQAIRFGNTVLAAIGGAVLTALVSYAYFNGDSLISWHLLGWILALFWSVNFLFIVTIKFGWNLRFREPALTMPQMLWASTSTLMALFFSEHWDGAYYLLVLLTMVFGVFRVELKKFNAYCAYIIALAILLVLLRYALFPLQRSLVGSLIYWLTFAFCAIALTRLCYSLMTLRNRLREKNEALEEALTARSYFLANMSHEIRTPMNGVLGMLDIVLRTELQAEQRRFLSIAQSSANGLLTIINDILDFSKIEAGKMNIEPIDFNLNHFVQEIIATFSARSVEKGLELILDMSPDLPGSIHCDPVRLRQVLNNLLGNALKFTEQGEVVLRVVIESKSEGDSVLWQVSDTGIGIPRDKQSELFESFTQADGSTTRVYGGTGLGLAICKQLCELMNGSISFVSEEGHGSCFEVCLPLVVGSTDRDEVIDARIEGVHIAVVDDNETNRLILSEQLCARGARVTTFGDPFEFLSEVQLQSSCAFDLAILDMQMPNMDGVMLAKRLRSLAQCDALVLVILTSLLEELAPSVLQSLRISAHLNKPIQPIFLYKTVSMALARPGTVLRMGDILARSDFPDLAEANNSESVLLGRRILLVEDNATNREVAVTVLQEMGLMVDVAEDGKQALAQLQNACINGYRFELILMDCMMPEMDGYTATAMIRQHPEDWIKNIPIIAMTANAMDGDKQKCLVAGMNDYVCKPIQIDLLEEALLRWMPSQSAANVQENRPVDTPPQNAPEVLHWDQSALMKLVRHKEERMVALLTPFLHKLDDHLSAIEQFLPEPDKTHVLQEIHSLKGASANLGARALPEFLAISEQQLRTVGISNPDEWTDRLRCLVAAMRKAMTAYLNPGQGQ